MCHNDVFISSLLKDASEVDLAERRAGRKHGMKSKVRDNSAFRPNEIGGIQRLLSAPYNKEKGKTSRARGILYTLEMKGTQ